MAKVQHICPHCQVDITREVRALVAASPKVRKLKTAAAEEVRKLRRRVKRSRAERQALEERLAPARVAALERQATTARNELASLEEAGQHLPIGGLVLARGGFTSPRLRRPLNARQLEVLRVAGHEAPERARP